jgi:hypothetical protein
MVFCEGRNSEPSYLREFARDKGIGVVNIKVVGGAGTPMTLVDAAREAKKIHARTTRKNSFAKNDSFWVAFDCDEHPSLEEARARADAASVNIAYSNPCFEIWLLAHVEGVTVDAPLTRQEAQHQLQEKVGSYNASSGKTADYAEISGGYDRARAAAAKMRARREEEGDPRGNPYTDFDNLTELIRLGPSD